MLFKQQHLDRQFFAVAGGHFLDVHQQAAVAVDVDHQLVGMGRLGAHGGRQAEAHRAQPAAGEPAPRLAELVILGRPHLMLAHADGDDSVAILGQPIQFVDGVLRQDAGESRRCSGTVRRVSRRRFSDATRSDRPGLRQSCSIRPRRISNRCKRPDRPF